MNEFPLSDPQFWSVTLLAVAAVVLLIVKRVRQSDDQDQNGSCGGCSAK